MDPPGRASPFAGIIWSEIEEQTASPQRGHVVLVNLAPHNQVWRPITRAACA